MNMLIRVLKNLPVFAWWLVLTYLALRHRTVLMTLSVAVMASGPLVYWALKEKPRGELSPLPRRLSAFSTLSTMTVLSLAKSALACGISPQKHGGMADRS
jgi:hypothetical protein